MANAKTPSFKQVLIDKTNTSIVIATSVAAFIVIFSLVSSKALISQAAYQNRVIGKQKATLALIKSDITAADALGSSYQNFTSQAGNVIGGVSNGSGPRDGNNAKIVLDALPSSYDFPALTSSLEAMLTSAGVQINSISGNDDEVAQAPNAISSTPQPVAMPFEVSVAGDYTSIQTLIGEFEHSIRPFQIQSLQISGDQNQLTMNVTAQTFYQPAKSLNFKNQVVN